MRASLTRYSVPGWGLGELWMRGSIVLAHDFAFVPDVNVGLDGQPNHLRAHPLKGAQRLPTSTVPPIPPPVENDFAPSPSQENGSHAWVSPDELAVRLTDYLAGADVALDDVELDLSWATSFQHSIAEALRGVPRGEVVTYGELAAIAGRPGAARAVGSFCAQNRFAFIVPCHRVVGAGGIGGYGSTGVAVKRRLLALEGAVR